MHFLLYHVTNFASFQGWFLFTPHCVFFHLVLKEQLWDLIHTPCSSSTQTAFNLMCSCTGGVDSRHQDQFSNFSIIPERSAIPLTPPLSPQTLQPEATAGLLLGSDNLPTSEHF